MLRIFEADDESGLRRLLGRPGEDLARARRQVAPIVEAVRRRGDAAVAAWAWRLDAMALAPRRGGGLPARITPAECAAAWRRTPPALRRALRAAAANIETMARWQMPANWSRTMAPGVRLGQLARPLASVGCYIPGGRHPLPSSVLMTAIPARVAGVPRIVAVCPRPAQAVLAAAHLAGVTELYRIGGPHGVAALAYGTATLPAVEKIVGPGNIYVTAAKQLLREVCDIDFLAGPTEVMIVAEAGANPQFIAADLIAQGEHDPRAVGLLVTDSRPLAAAVARALREQLRRRPNPVAARSLRARGGLVLTNGLRQSMAVANRVAPEHITLPPRALPWLQSAGSVFLGDYAPQAAGDYLTGANHVLPTSAVARRRGGLSVLDFLKVVTVQRLTRSGLQRLAPAIAALAAAEGLPGHADSVAIRLARPRATAGRA